MNLTSSNPPSAMKPDSTIAMPDGTTAHYCKDHADYRPPHAFYPSDLRSGQRICAECRTSRRKRASRKCGILSNFKQQAKRASVDVRAWELSDVAELFEDYSDEDLKLRCLRPKDPTAASWTPGECVVVLKSEATRIRKPRKLIRGGV